jgi:hypothetical protein
LAKIIDRLHELGRPEQTPMGFGTSSGSPGTAAMLLIGRLGVDRVKDGATRALESVDALLLDGPPDKAATKSLGDSVWGVRLTDASIEMLDGLRDGGCDFIHLESEEAAALVLRDDGMARGFAITISLDEERGRALDDLPLDFLLLEYEVQPSQLTVARLMELQTAVSKVSKHIFLKAGDCPSPSELELLRDLPVDAIVLDIDPDDDAGISAARAAIDALEPRKPRGHRDGTPLIPQAGVSEAVDNAHEDEDWDDDWDDNPGETKVRD